MYGRGDPGGRPVVVVGATLAVALDPALAANPQFLLEPFKMLSVFHQNKCHYFRHDSNRCDNFHTVHSPFTFRFVSAN